MPDGAPRIKGFGYTGPNRYSLTVCASGRKAVFSDADLVSRVLAEVNQQAEAHRFVVHVHCFMPDHLHLLVEGVAEESDLKQFVKAWKQRTGYDYSRRTGSRLWQVGYFDHVLRSDESTRRHALYILGNPVRAGLARSIGEYPFAGSASNWIDGPGPEACRPEA